MAVGTLMHGEITAVILNLFYKRVFAQLGYGFLEKVVENAMAYELQKSGLNVVKQQKIEVCYQGIVMGEYFADLVINDKVIVELKAASQLLPQHEAQLLNYLRATKYEVGLLLNFGPKPTHRRKVFNNDRKNTTWIPKANPLSSTLVRVPFPMSQPQQHYSRVSE